MNRKVQSKPSVGHRKVKMLITHFESGYSDMTQEDLLKKNVYYPLKIQKKKKKKKHLRKFVHVHMQGGCVWGCGDSRSANAHTPIPQPPPFFGANYFKIMQFLTPNSLYTPNIAPPNQHFVSIFTPFSE